MNHKCPSKVMDALTDRTMSSGSKNAQVVCGLIKSQKTNYRIIYRSAACCELIPL
jgi:hypothetical protein